MKKRALIVGGGFAGLAALNTLGRSSSDVEVTLADPRAANHFLPLLPDLIGRRLPGKLLKYPLGPAVERAGAHFLHTAVRAIAFEEREALTDQGPIAYDYLVLAAGGETTFFGHDEFKPDCHTLDTVDDGEGIVFRLEEDDFDRIFIVGGGYAGLEIATVLWRYYAKRKMLKPITILEKADAVLSRHADFLSTYAEENLKRLGVNVIYGNTLASIEGRRVELESGAMFDRACVIWAAGRQTAACVRELDVDQNTQGRLAVDPYLRFHEGCYAAGDAAGFEVDGSPIRMGVQFALSEGAHAARNILREVAGGEPQPFKPVDLGHVVPMANGRSCGVVLGRPVTGRIPTLLHYFMSVFRSYGWSNRTGLLRRLLVGG